MSIKSLAIAWLGTVSLTISIAFASPAPTVSQSDSSLSKAGATMCTAFEGVSNCN